MVNMTNPIIDQKVIDAATKLNKVLTDPKNEFKTKIELGGKMYDYKYLLKIYTDLIKLRSHPKWKTPDELLKDKRTVQYKNSQKKHGDE
jgi:hypothetical protein